MKLLPSILLFAATALFAHSSPVPEPQQRQAAFVANYNSFLAPPLPIKMDAPPTGNSNNNNGRFVFDMDTQGPPQLSDVLAREKGATIALDAILQSELLVRAISGKSADFDKGLTLLLPTNRAFQSLGSLPDDLETVMKRHFIPQVISPKEMASGGAAIDSYQKLAKLRFSTMHGKVYVRANQWSPVEVRDGRNSGTQTANSGSYFLVDELFL